MMRYLCLLFIGAVRLKIVSCQDDSSVQSPAKLYPFVKFNSVSLLEFQEKVNVSRSYEARNPIQCAHLIVNDCSSCKPLGFLYDTASRACQPIFWRDGIEIVLQDLGPGNSSLYSFRTNHCSKEGFETYVEKVGNYSITSCIHTNYRKQQLYPNAIRHCKVLGAVLAPAKTQERLALLVKLSQVMYLQLFWIGLDHFGRALPFQWVDDGTELTQQQQEELFEPGEPTQTIRHNCVTYRAPGNKLNNEKCDQLLLFFCEMKPGC